MQIIINSDAKAAIKFVATFEEASEALRAHFKETGEGASSMRLHCGDVLTNGPASRTVARISYNGRIWLPNGEEFDPSAEASRMILREVAESELEMREFCGPA